MFYQSLVVKVNKSEKNHMLFTLKVKSWVYDNLTELFATRSVLI